MVIHNWDDTFTTNEITVHDPNEAYCNPYPIYGKAWACPTPRGVAKVDFRNTGFYIPDSVSRFSKHGKKMNFE